MFSRDMLNENLIKSQGLTDNDVDLIVEKHREREEVFAQMEQTKTSSELKTLAKEVEEIEYELQALWKFQQDRSYHSWWFMVPQCECPTASNWRRFGTEERVINESCPIHGLD